MSEQVLKGYCYNCKREVTLQREPINMCLVIILLIFTAGIGLIFYFYIHYKHPPDRCSGCGWMVKFSEPSKQLTVQEYVKTNQIEAGSEIFNANGVVTGRKAEYCPLCGEFLEKRDAKHCPSCGSEI